MSLNVGYFLRATLDIYGVIASYLRPRAILVTLGTLEPEEEIERAHPLCQLAVSKIVDNFVGTL
jgi:hypothetical protein